MKHIRISFVDTCLISEKELENLQHTLHEEIDRIIIAQQHKYDTDYAALNAPFDDNLIEIIKSLAAEKLALKPTVLIIIGIGGSNLGTAAVIQALRGIFYNNTGDLKVYFADTVDTNYIHEILHITKQALSSGNAILLNVISKSGTTTETVANFQLFFDILKRYHPHDYHKYIVITTDKNSPLDNFAEQNGMDCLIVPTKVGGRYSIFSAVGLFPLALLSIDIKELCAGAQNATQLCTDKNYTNNPATTSAMIMYLLYKKGYVIHNSFIFSVAMENMGKWYRQLMAESIGKAIDRDGNMINNGMLPIVSIGSTDLHSVAQLYLSGPHNIFTTFISIEKNSYSIEIPHNIAFEQLASTVQQKSFVTIMNAILQGTQIAYNQDHRPFIHCVIPELSAYYSGQLMQIKMYEMIYLGFLMNINPFDQPQVELYKKETKKLLE